LDARVDVGGYALHMMCTGSGTPTVVLDAGLGSNSRLWQKVMPEVSKVTRVCSYDRPNLGQSDPALRTLRRIGSSTYIELRSGQALVRDLQDLLRKTKEPSPYVLVGHSFSGLSAILHAHQHADEIVGLALVDSAHPDQVLRLEALMTPTEAKLDHDRLMRNREGFDIDRIIEEVLATRWRSNIPLIVLAQGRPASPSTARSMREEQVWRELQVDLSRRSPNGKSLRTAGTTSISINRSWSSVRSERCSNLCGLEPEDNLTSLAVGVPQSEKVFPESGPHLPKP
jgi:pimeloyl-ACP methyl ester carboxylesterase